MHAHKIEMDHFRKQMAIENLELKKQRQLLSEKLAEKTLSKNEPGQTKQSDQFGPYATNWDEVGERVRIGHGISKEEWARRLALHKRPQNTDSAGADYHSATPGILEYAAPSDLENAPPPPDFDAAPSADPR